MRTPYNDRKRFRSSSSPDISKLGKVMSPIGPIPHGDLDVSLDERIIQCLQRVSVLEVELQTTKVKLNRVEQENVNLKQRLIRVERVCKSKDLKFWGIWEPERENRWDCKRTIFQVLNDSGIELSDKAIERARRIGPKINGKNRAILVQFFHYEEKSIILAKAGHIKVSTNVWIEENFPNEVESNRRELKHVLQETKRHTVNGNHPFKGNLVEDTLYVNNKSYTVKSLDRLPEPLKLEKIFTRTKDNTTAFFRKYSPLSNHYLTEQKVEGNTYNCNEQYYFHKKADLAGDRQAAEQIMKEKDPGKQKAIGSRIVINEPMWRDRCIDIMYDGLRAKFTQNKKLQDFLLSTGNNLIIEASPRDKFWGVGIDLHNPKIWNTRSWQTTAENKLGQMLMQLRREIRNE